jgi:hypothetical protein
LLRQPLAAYLEDLVVDADEGDLRPVAQRHHVVAADDRFSRRIGEALALAAEG